MIDHTLKDLGELVAANPDVPWDTFVCTPVLESKNGKALGTATRCAVTAGGLTVMVRLPHEVTIGRAGSWPPRTVIDAMMETLGPAAEV